MSRSEYTSEEKYKILRHIINNKQYTSLRSKSYWMKMEEDKICTRTWQSLKNHFKMKLVHNLHLFTDIPQKERDNILKGYNSTATTKTKKDGRKIRLPVFSICFSEDEDEESEPDQPPSKIAPVEADINEDNDEIISIISDFDQSFGTIPVNKQLSAPIRIRLSSDSDDMCAAADNNLETNQQSSNQIEITKTPEVQVPSNINHVNKSDQSVQVKTYIDASTQYTPNYNEIPNTSDVNLGANGQNAARTRASLRRPFRANISAADHLIESAIKEAKITGNIHVSGLVALTENLAGIVRNVDDFMLEGSDSEG